MANSIKLNQLYEQYKNLNSVVNGKVFNFYNGYFKCNRKFWQVFMPL